MCIYIHINTHFLCYICIHKYILYTQGPQDGTLEVVPMLADAIAYLLLRPFLSDVPVHQFCGVTETGGSDTLEVTSRFVFVYVCVSVSVCVCVCINSVVSRRQAAATH